MRRLILLGLLLIGAAAPAAAQTGFSQFVTAAPALPGSVIATNDLLAVVRAGHTYKAPGPSIAPLPMPASNTELAALSTANYPLITRYGFAAIGDSPALEFAGSTSPCSLNSGAGDGGSQVPSVNGGCWLAIFPAEGMDVRWFGAASGGAAATNLTAFNAAAAVDGALAVVPAGSFDIASAITENSKSLFQMAPGARTTGAGAIGQGTNSYIQTAGTCDVQTTPACIGNFQVYRYSNYPGTFGNVGFAMYGYSKAEGAGPHFEWTAGFQMDNNASDGENAALVAKIVSQHATAHSWAFVAELVDTTGNANSTTPHISQEIDYRGNGTDNNNMRALLDIHAKTEGVGAALEVAFGVRLVTDFGASYKLGFDCESASISLYCLRLGTDQAINFHTGSDAALFYSSVNGALTYRVGGVDVMTVNDAGGVNLIGASLTVEFNGQQAISQAGTAQTVGGGAAITDLVLGNGTGVIRLDTPAGVSANYVCAAVTGEIFVKAGGVAC